MEPLADPTEEIRRLRRTMRDLVALSTLPAVWTGLGPEGIAGSLTDVLLNTLSLDLIYVRLASRSDEGVIEVARSRHPDAADLEVARLAFSPLFDTDLTESAIAIPDPFGSGTLQVAITRFGVGEEYGLLLAASGNAAFPSERDRLLLGVGANQTAIVIQRQRAEARQRDQQEWLRVTLSSIGDAVIATDTKGSVTFLNQVAEKLTGWTQAEAQGRPLELVFNIRDEQSHQPVENPVEKVLRDGAIVGLSNHTILISRDGTTRHIDDSSAPIRDTEGTLIGVVLTFRDATEQRRIENQRNARLAATHALNAADSIHAGAVRVLRAVCENLGWDVGFVWLVNEHGEGLDCHASWHRPDVPAESFENASCGRTFALGEGLPGRALATGKPVWILDIERDGQFPRLATAVGCGLHSAFAYPLLIGDLKLGVIEFFTNRIRQPDENLLEMMGTVAGNVGQFIERKTAEERLRRSEQELGDFFENATVGLHWVGPDGIILRANRAELEMLGYSREEYVGQPIAKFHVDDDVICDILKRLEAGESLREYPAQLRCKNGSIKDVLIDSSVLWKDGQFIHTRCFTRDITERKRAEIGLADARSRLHAALEAGAIATWTWDIPNNRLFADQSLARLFNLDPSAAEGGLLDQYVESIHPEDRPRVIAALDQSLQTGKDYEADYRIVQADGSVRWVTARGRAERDSSGRPVRMPGVLVDITERKVLEEELRLRVEQLAEADRRKDELLSSLQESEEKLRLLADTIPQLAWMARPDGHIFWYNRRWYEYTGKTLQQMEGWGWQSVHDPEVLPTVLEQWKKAIATGEPFEMVFPLRSSDNQFRPFLTRINPLKDDKGRILYWFGTNTDISDIKRMETALRDADRRKDEFLATLAHELRNPLAPIRNSLQILKMPRVDEATVQQTRDMMERQVDHLVRLVDDLLDVARVMRGKIDLRKEPIELATVVARAVETVQPLIQIQGHDLQISVSADSLLLDVDAIRLAQVLGNLLTNSAKYTESGGRIWLTADREGDQAVVRVRDNGIGIAPDMLPYVFELFVQADHATTRAQGGLGIGLTLVKNLVQMHGGSVSAHSAGLNRGSEFVVRLPLMQQRPEENSQRANDGSPENVRSPGYKLLVVDDNMDSAISLARLLRLQGHEVQIAHDGISAIEAANASLPDLILLDIGMPGMDGYEVAKRIRQTPNLERTVLAALTGWGQEEDRRRTADAGFDYHLIKPLGVTALTSVLDSVGRRQEQS